MSTVIILHVTFGGVALVSGFIALLSTKGKALHRHAGKVFVLSMLIMAFAGSIVAFKKPEMITLLAGLFTCYLVLSALLTVRSVQMLRSLAGMILALLALSIGIAGIYYGYQANQSLSKLYDGFSASPYLFFGALALVAGLSDLKIYFAKNIAGKNKIARHAWRMCFALLIAASSFFDGPGAAIFPDSMQGSFILLVPQLCVAILLVYWLVNVLYFKKFSRFSS